MKPRNTQNTRNPFRALEIGTVTNGTKIRYIPGANVDVDLDFDVVLDLDLDTAWTGMIRRMSHLQKSGSGWIVHVHVQVEVEDHVFDNQIP
jgi:hypothetical protein